MAISTTIAARDPLEIAPGAPITAELLRDVARIVNAGPSRVMHLSIACGSAGWDDYAATSDGEGAGTGVGAAVRPGTTGTASIFQSDIYLDVPTSVLVRVGWVITGGTWDVTVEVGATSATFFGRTVSGEDTATMTVASAGWHRVELRVTLASGAGTFEPRLMSLAEAPVLGEPADD